MITTAKNATRAHQHRLLARAVAVACLWLITLGAPSLASGQAPQAAGDHVLEGVLDPAGSNGPTLKAGGREIALTTHADYLMHVLQDSRLAGRQMHLLGEPLAGGKFEVHRLFTVKDGKLFKVRYFCDTCNITTVQPGNCSCCGQPTRLKEIPAEATDI